MAKKIVKIEDEKPKSKIDLGQITKTLVSNGEAIEKIAEGVNEIINSQKNDKKTTKVTSKTKTTSKSKTDGLSKVIDIAETLLK